MRNGPRLYNLFPTLVGSIDRWIEQCPRIAAMGFDWIYLNPFHAVGESGSLYAVADYYRINPVLRGDSPLDDDALLRSFIEAARAAGLRVMMDLVVNHTARDSRLTDEYPQWYRREADGRVASPYAVNPDDPSDTTVWTDLAEIDYTQRPERDSTVAYFSGVVRHYTRLGIGGFRCDAAYKVPGDVWRSLIDAARAVEPTTRFAAETLGAAPDEVMQLSVAGFDYLFNSSKWWDFESGWLLDQYDTFGAIAPSIAFPESHDTPRLAADNATLDAAGLEALYKQRYAFAACFSAGVMMTTGYEYGFDAAVDVVMTRPHHWQQPRFDISAYIAACNAMKAAIPALNDEGVQTVAAHSGAAVALRRYAREGDSAAVTLVNPSHTQSARFAAAQLFETLADPVEVTPFAARADVSKEIELAPLSVRVFASGAAAQALLAAARNGAANGSPSGPTRVAGATAPSVAATVSANAPARGRGAAAAALSAVSSAVGNRGNGKSKKNGAAAQQQQSSAPAPSQAHVNSVPPTQAPAGSTSTASPSAAQRACGGVDLALRARPIVIEHVTPGVDDGRYPVKRIVGDRVIVEADIFREGHDAIEAVLRYRERGAAAWREAPMTALGNDRWRGAFVLERNARYAFTIEAWPDAYGSWEHGAHAKHDAGQPIALELREGLDLVLALRERATPAECEVLASVQRAFEKAPDDDARLSLLTSQTVRDLARARADRSLGTTLEREREVTADRRIAQFGAWYEFFPRSAGRQPGVHGTFADAQARLAAIHALGFDVVYLPPIHPIGHAFRKGRNNSLNPDTSDPGSPWAIGNADGGHTAIEPALGTFDDFARFVAAADNLGLAVALDYALQCSPDHPYVREHPEWFAFRADGSIKYAENPPKKYQDIVNFNWFGPHAPALWAELRDVVEFWIARGVRIFRVDNPHTKPFAFWEWMIGDVQSRHPDVLFLAEAFTRPRVMEALAKRGFTQSYTYFTWRNTKAELIAYLTELSQSERADYFRPNFFANTPDILPPYLQSGGRPAFIVRLVLAATLGSTYGIYSGYELGENAALPGREEYADSEKYEIRVRDYDAPGNLNAEITRINRIRRDHRALHDWRNVEFLESSDDVLFYAKAAGSDVLLIAVNLDPFRAVDAELVLPFLRFGYAYGESMQAEDLLFGDRFTWGTERVTVRLDPQRNPAAVFRIDARTGRR